MAEIIRLPQMLRDAEVRAGSFDEASNTIDVIWTTGATVRRVSWIDGVYDEELIVSPNAVRLGRLNAGASFLDTHADFSLDDVLGNVVRGSARIEGGKGYASVKLSGAPGALDRVAKIKEGTVSNISVRYMVHAVERREADGKVPVHRVIDWEPTEISAVPTPADFGSQVLRSNNAETFACEVRRPLADLNTTRAIRMRMLSRHHGLAG